MDDPRVRYVIVEVKEMEEVDRDVCAAPKKESKAPRSTIGGTLDSGNEEVPPSSTVDVSNLDEDDGPLPIPTIDSRGSRSIKGFGLEVIVAVEESGALVIETEKDGLLTSILDIIGKIEEGTFSIPRSENRGSSSTKGGIVDGFGNTMKDDELVADVEEDVFE
jgi:hypothetical protein